MQLLWNCILWDSSWTLWLSFILWCGNMFLYINFFQTEEDYIPYPSVHEVGSHFRPTLVITTAFYFINVPKSSIIHYLVVPLMFHFLQVLGRKSPFPLILLPQFGGYWIEGTTHELGNSGEAEQLRPPSPNSRTKLECNTTATLFRKHFLGKVSHMLNKHTVCLCPASS